MQYPSEEQVVKVQPFEERDVVVVGAGGAGLAAALAAAVDGASVALLESEPLVGGAAAVSGGALWLPGSEAGRRAGVHDRHEDAVAYLQAATRGEVDAEVLDAYVDHARELEALIADHTALELAADVERPDYRGDLPGASAGGRMVGAGLFDVRRLGEAAPLLRRPDWPGGTEPVLPAEMARFLAAGDQTGWRDLAHARVASGVLARGTALVAALLEACLHRGVRLRTGEGAADLSRVADGRHLVVTAGGSRLLAPGVVIAAGGFEWDRALWDELVGVPHDALLSPPVGRGDGLRLARSSGAQLRFLDRAWWQAKGGGDPGSLAVDARGARVLDERTDYHDYGLLLARGRIARPLWELRGGGASVSGPVRGTSDPDRTGPTLTDLARELGIDPGTLEQTVARFDDGARAGRDPDFGRGTTPWDRYRADPALAPLGPGPYTARRVRLHVYGTKGGAVIDRQARVLDPAGAVIPGLFAAGNSAACVFGDAYPGAGAPLGAAMVFGVLAGRGAALTARERRA